jgi:hypothetical protein
MKWVKLVESHEVQIRRAAASEEQVTESSTLQSNPLLSQSLDLSNRQLFQKPTLQHFNPSKWLSTLPLPAAAPATTLSAPVVCDIIPAPSTNTILTIPQLKRPPALAVKSPLSSAHAPRPPSRTPSTDPDAPAVLVPLASAPATVLLPRTLLLAVLHALADLVPKVCGTLHVLGFCVN